MDVDFFGEEVEYRNASLGKRFANYAIDYVAQMLIGLAIGIVIGVIIAYNDPAALDTIENADGLSSKIWELLLGYLLAIIYYFVLEATTGRTLGKLITKTKVVMRNGDEPSHGTIFKRTLCRLIPFEPFSFFGGDEMGWHDSISNTRVVEIPNTWHTQSDLNTRDDRDKDQGLNTREG